MVPALHPYSEQCKRPAASEIRPAGGLRLPGERSRTRERRGKFKRTRAKTHKLEEGKVYRSWGRTKLRAKGTKFPREPQIWVFFFLIYFCNLHGAQAIVTAYGSTGLEIGRAGFCRSHAREQVASRLLHPLAPSD